MKVCAHSSLCWHLFFRLASSERQCDFASLQELDSPALITDAVSVSDHAKRFGSAELQLRHRGTLVEYGHPTFIVTGLGTSTQTMPLGDWLGNRSAAQFVWDRGVIGRGVKVRLPSILKRQVRKWKKDNRSRVFSLGSDGTGLGFHGHGASVFVLLTGEKRWAVAPPGSDLPPDVRPSTTPDAHGKKLLGRLRHGDAGSSLHWCTQTPGTAIYLPAGWLHATFNVGETVAGLAMQDNSPRELVVSSQRVLSQQSSSWPTSLALLVVGQHGPAAPDIKSIKRAVRLDPANIGALFLLSDMLRVAKRRHEAINRMHAAAELARKLSGVDGTDELASVWLTQIGFALCVPLRRILDGAALLEEAVLTYNASMVGHVKARHIQACRELAAQPEVVRRMEAQHNVDDL